MPDWRQVARQAALQHGVDPGIFERQIDQESGFRPDAESSAGAKGIAQLMPDTARGLGVDPMRPREALDGAARWMGELLRRYGGDYRKALAAYNAGPGAVEKYGGVPPFEQTLRYVANILGSVIPGVAKAEAAGADEDGMDESLLDKAPGDYGGMVAPSAPQPSPATTPTDSTPFGPSLPIQFNLPDVALRKITAQAARGIGLKQDPYPVKPMRPHPYLRGVQEPNPDSNIRYDFEDGTYFEITTKGQMVRDTVSRAITAASRRGATGTKTIPDGKGGRLQEDPPGSGNWVHIDGTGKLTDDDLLKSGSEYYLRNRKTGVVQHIDLPVPPGGDEKCFSHAGGYYCFDPRNQNATPRQVLAPPDPKDRLTPVHIDPTQPSLVFTDANGNVVTKANPAYNADQADLAAQAARQKLMGKQQLLIQQRSQLIDDLVKRVGDNTMSPEDANSYYEANRRYTDAALQDTTPYQMQRDQEAAQQRGQQLAEQLLSTRMAHGATLAQTLISSAMQLAMHAVPKPGGYHLDFPAMADEAMTRLGGSDYQTLAATLMAAATRAPQPILPTTSGGGPFAVGGRLPSDSSSGTQFAMGPGAAAPMPMAAPPMAPAPPPQAAVAGPVGSGGAPAGAPMVSEQWWRPPEQLPGVGSQANQAA